MKIKVHYILFLCSCLCAFLSTAQTFNLPIDDNLPKCIEESYFSNPQKHTLIRPLQIDIADYQNLIDSCFSNKEKKHWITDKNFIELKNDKRGLILNPVLTDIYSPLFLENGLSALVWSGKNFTGNLTGSYIYTQPDAGNFPTFPAPVIPHFGKYKYESSNNSYSYLNLTGYVSWQVADFMNLQVGRDKVFWGDGYRSLLISDNSNAFPFFKGTVDMWKVKYTILYSSLNELDSVAGQDFNQKKYTASHILSWNIGKRLNFNMFETVIWRGQDSLGTRGFDVNYLNPIVFYRPVEFSLGSPDNVIMGFGLRLRIFKTTHLYGQFLLDEFNLSELKAKTGWWGNKFGIQAGVKTYRLFGIKNLFALGEVNIVKPFTYSHWDYMENYGNFSQPLAHPLGSNFAEGIANVRYLINRISINALLTKYVIGKDYDTMNMGENIYRSYNDHVNPYGNKILQGRELNITSVEISLGYILNPKWNLSFRLGFRYRFTKYQMHPQTSPTDHSTGYYTSDNRFLFFGFYTNIGNREGLY